MKRNLRSPAAVALAIFMGGVLAAASASMVFSVRIGKADPDGPEAFLASTQCDLKTISRGSVVRARFPISNRGGRRLILVEHVEACCGQSAAARQVSLAPGESTELAVEIDPGRWDGRVSQIVRYTTNDPRLPRFSLVVTALLEPSSFDGWPQKR
ncbi:MAG: DUF1573 domain-containing protein [Rhodopirellula sp.]|nr:DUF1573 domain-containing protein [Rhodopirellula sp.]